MAATEATLVSNVAQSRAFVDQEVVSRVRTQSKPKRSDVISGCDLCPLEPPRNLLFEPRLPRHKLLFGEVVLQFNIERGI